MDKDYWIVSTPTGHILQTTMSENRAQAVDKFLSLIKKETCDLPFLQEQGYNINNIKIVQLELF